MNKQLKISASLVLAILFLTGCSSKNDETAKKIATITTHQEKSQSTSTAKLKTPTITLSQSAAVNKFQKRFSNTQISEIDLELENGRYVYKISGFDTNKEHTLLVDAHSGKVLRQHSENRDVDDQDEKGIDLTKIISRSQANKIAQKHTEGSPREWKLEEDDGQVMWEIKMVNSHQENDVKIDALTKKVLRIESD